MPSPTPPASAPGGSDRLQQALQRLDRLEGYLRSDPQNNTLRIDAFETALSCSAWDRAAQHLEAGQAAGTDALGWTLREGDFWLAQREDDRARAVLEQLQGAVHDNPVLRDVLIHNLAFIDFRQGHSAQAIARLDAAMQRAPRSGAQAVQASTAAALQTLWLRAHHQAGLVDEACDWARQCEQAGEALAPGAAGVAALIAIDADELALAQRWCAQATVEEPARWNSETLVAAGTLALGLRQAARALELAEAALARNAREGRAWSLRAFAQMLAQDLQGALASFAEAVQHAPGHIGTWIGRAWAQLLAQDLPAARASFESALALDRNFGESHGGLAVVLAMQGERDTAAQHAEFAERLDRRNLSAQFARAILQGEVADQAGLLRLAKRILGGIELPEGGVASDLLKFPPRKP